MAEKDIKTHKANALRSTLQKSKEPCPNCNKGASSSPVALDILKNVLSRFGASPANPVCSCGSAPVSGKMIIAITKPTEEPKKVLENKKVDHERLKQLLGKFKRPKEESY